MNTAVILGAAYPQHFSFISSGTTGLLYSSCSWCALEDNGGTNT